MFVRIHRRALRSLALAALIVSLVLGSLFAFVGPARAATTVSVELDAPIVGMTSTPDGRGYWMVGSDGGVFTFGDARFSGSMGGRHLDAPIVGMADGPSNSSYWLVGSDGGIFTFGDAHFFGSMGGKHLDAPIVGMASAPNGNGYWLVASDGGVFTFGDAHFFGSMGGKHLDAPIVGMAADRATSGYWLVASDGGLFAFHSKFDGSDGADPTPAPVKSIVSDAASNGYWLAGETGNVSTFGAAAFEGDLHGILRTDPPAAPASADGGRVLAVAASQVGQTDPYTYGPAGEAWCAYFASWVYRHAGIPMPSMADAYEIGAWALANGGSLLAPSATPQVGDAVLFEPPGSSLAWPDQSGLNFGNIEHVNIVAEVLPGDQIITIGGNESGAVREQGPYSAADASSWWGQAIYAFVRPPGV
jgi:CHAP domain